MAATFWDWTDVYEQAYGIPGDLSALACPNCGHDTLNLVYTGDLDDRVGYGTFWCEACRQGIGISRAVVPDGAILRDRHLPADQRQPHIPGDVMLVPPTALPTI